MDRPKSVEGLSIQSDRNILISDEAEIFADEIDRLLTNRHLAASLGKCGREVVNAHYSWKTIMQDFHNALHKCVTAKPK